MQLNRPLSTVTPTLDADVLALLAQQESTLTTGQLHRMLGAWSEGGIRKVLTRLLRQGVVDSRRAGATRLYSLNRDHLAAGPIIELANLGSTLLSRLEERLAGWTVPPTYAAVFGSAATGTMTPESDLDLLLVHADGVPRTIWDEQVGTLLADVRRWTGNDAQSLEYSVSELTAARDEPVLRDVLAVGLTVAGTRAWLHRQVR